MTNQPIVSAIDRPSPTNAFTMAQHASTCPRLSRPAIPALLPCRPPPPRPVRATTQALLGHHRRVMLTRVARDHHPSSRAPVSYINSTTCDTSLHRPRSIECNKFLLGYIPPIPLLLPTTIWSISPAKPKPKKTPNPTRPIPQKLSQFQFDRSLLSRLPVTNTQSHGLQPGSVRRRLGVPRAPHPSP